MMHMHLAARKQEFLVFSDDWGEHPSSCQHIFRIIGKEHRVLWVNTIGMRNPTWTARDAKKAVKKAAKMLRSANGPNQGKNRDGNISVCQPMMLPGVRSRVVRWFNARSVTRTVRTAMRELRFEDPIVVTTVPNAVEYRDLLVDRRVIYYCVDDFSLWPGLDAESVQGMERRLVARADRIIAVSDALSRRFKEFGKDASVVTHGVDIELFATVALREHPRLQHVQKPRVGFFGLIDGRLDWELLVPLAQRLPNVSFVLAGPVDASAGELPVRGNIHFVGAVPYRELPEFITGVKALVLPYKTGALAKVLSPLKLKEYLATGKPVICAPIEAVREWVDVVGVGATVDEWETLLRRVLECEQIEQEHCVSERLALESWDVKASTFRGRCMDIPERELSRREKSN